MKPVGGILFLTMSLLALFPRCQHRGSDDVGLEQLHRAVQGFHQAINSGDTGGAVAMFTEDVIFLSNGWEPVRGKEAVAEIWMNSITSGFRTKDQEIIELAIDGDIAFEATRQLWTMHREGQEGEWRSSKYVHIWKRQPDGSWKLHLDIWNSNPLPQ